MKRMMIRFLALLLGSSMLLGCAAKKNVTISGETGIDETPTEWRTNKEDDADAEGTVASDEALGAAVAEKETDEPAAQSDNAATPETPVEIEGLYIKDMSLSDCKKSGLYGYPYDSDIVYSINNVTNGTIQLQSSPLDMLFFGCKLTLDSADTVTIEMRVYEYGVLLVTGGYDVDLAAGENSFQAFIKLPHEVSGDYIVELWYNGQPAAADVL